ncbi:AAA family ATPase [Aeromonas enteropelogenes]|uniref:AAA family ATPase n=1 Tax=Aeromonas enteropelogenes TaxID=29489 RepID=UPI003989FA97
MKILKFSFNDSIKKIRINEIEVGNKNLLVGVSGAGKTTIMTALGKIKRISSGTSSPGDSWSITFIDNNGCRVDWYGQFKTDTEYDEEDNAELISESIIVDGEQLYIKKNGVSFLAGNKLPSIDKNKSIIHSLRDDDSVKDIYTCLQSIVLISSNARNLLDELMIPYFNESASKTLAKEAKEDGKKMSLSLTKINELLPSLDIRHKIYFCSKYDTKQFEYFSFVFKSIFPHVKEVKPVKRRAPSNSVNPKQGVSISLVMEDNSTVAQENISSGMFKSMIIIAFLYLGAKNTVLLIDEIENGLGVNCLPDIISELQGASVQTIISTHHPRIINEIKPKDWHIVTRNGGLITASRADEIVDSTSVHDPFIKLINSKKYKLGSQ